MEKVQTPAAEVKTVPLSQLNEGHTNPRRGDGDVESLALSIEQDGILQSLIVTKSAVYDGYIVVGGARRLKALELLRTQGKIEDDYPVPVQVRSIAVTAETDGELRRLGMVENIQRQDLHPLDETAAWLELMSNGMEVDDLAVRTGLTVRTIKRRLALTNLIEDFHQPFREGLIGIGQAQALSLGSQKGQKEMLEHLEESEWGKDSWSRNWDADDIINYMLDQRVPVTRAIFPKEQYTGTYTTNLFQEDEETFFDDGEQFLALQRAEVERRIEEYKANEKVEFVDFYDGEYPHFYQYENARKNAKKYGVVVWWQRHGEVEFRGPVKKRDLSDNTTSSLGSAGGPTGERPKPPKPYYQPKLALEIGEHKTMAVQYTLLNNPRKAKEIAALKMLVGWSKRGTMHEGQERIHKYVDQAMRVEEEDVKALSFRPHVKALDDIAKEVLRSLYPDIPFDDEGGLRALRRAQDGHIGDKWWSNYGDEHLLDAYARIKKLDDATLEKLLLLLPILTFGEESFESIDNKTSIFNTVAQDLAVDMKEHWRPDRAFLEMRTVPQLQKIAQDTAANSTFAKPAAKKKELVNALEQFFDAAESEHARTWLPGAMQFPAVDETAPVVEEADPQDDPNHPDHDFHDPEGGDEPFDPEE